MQNNRLRPCALWGQWSESPCPGFWQAVNGARKSHQGCSVKNEVDTDYQANKIGAGCWPSGEKINAECDGDESGDDGPSPSWELNHTGSGYTEQSSHDEQCGDNHRNGFRARVWMADQKISGHAANNGI